MKYLLCLFALFLAACDSEVRKEEPSKEPPKPVAPVSGVTHIECPHCKGAKRIRANTSSYTAETKIDCPVCSGRGFRDFKVPPGKFICAECQGMGNLITFNPKSPVPQRVSCSRCFGSGAVSDSAPKR